MVRAINLPGAPGVRHIDDQVSAEWARAVYNGSCRDE